jgi:hypothetical protein
MVIIIIDIIIILIIIIIIIIIIMMMIIMIIISNNDNSFKLALASGNRRVKSSIRIREERSLAMMWLIQFALWASIHTPLYLHPT